jgi:hypothetical protein
MLRRALLVLLSLWTLTLGTGCGATLVPFSHELRDRNGLTTADLKNLQYYISRRVVLRRELESGGKEITGSHQLVVVSGHQIEEVVIEEHTPGIAVAVGPKSLTVTFEPGSVMVFTPESGERVAAEVPGGFAEAPNPFPANDGSRSSDPSPFPGVFAQGNYTLATDGPRTILYQGKRFDVVGESGQASLMIDAKSLEQVSLSREVAPGMRLR